MALFGFKPTGLVGQRLAKFVDVFQALESETEELIAKMILKVRPGCAAERSRQSDRVARGLPRCRTLSAHRQPRPPANHALP